MTEYSYQLYSSREFPPLSDTMKMVRKHGYSQVEAYAGLFDDVGAVKAALDETGLTMPSSHFGLDMLENEPDRVLEIAETLGIRKVYCPHIAADLRPHDAKGWRAFGERLERCGRPIRDAGLGFGWHNHDFEFKRLSEGTLPMQHILAGGPSLNWEADLAWIVRGGGDPFAWIRDYGDRMDAVHVKDIAPEGECVDEDGWADVGYGTMDWPGLVRALDAAGVTLYIMEHDKPNDHERFARRSIASVRSYRGDK